MADLLEVNGVSKSFGATRALVDVTVRLGGGEVVAVLGENGAGKSTLIKILSGVLAPDRGELRIAGRPVVFARPRDSLDAGIAYIPQELGVVGSLTVAENLVLGAWPSRYHLTSRRRILRRAEEICAQTGIDLPLKRLAAGLRLSDLQEIEIAKALARDARLILLDEPTAALSQAEAQHLFTLVGKLTARGVGIIFVSHRLDEVAGHSDRICVLRNGRNVAVLDGRTATRADLIRHMVGVAGEAHVPRAEAAPADVLSAAAIRPRGGAARSAAGGPPAGGPRRPAARPALRVSGLAAGGQPGLHGVELEVHPGEVVGVYGIRGSGAALIAECLGGEAPRAAGRLEIDGAAVRLPRNPRAAQRLGIAYIPPDRKHGGLFPNLSVVANLGMARLGDASVGGILSARRERAHAAPLLADLRVKLRHDRQNVMALSGGNQQKVLVGSRIAAARRVLVAQEPTRGVDIGARNEIHRLIRDLAAGGRAALVASSDVEEIVEVSDRVVVIRDGRLVSELSGTGITQAQVIAAAAGAPVPGE